MYHVTFIIRRRNLTFLYKYTRYKSKTVIYAIDVICTTFDTAGSKRIPVIFNQIRKILRFAATVFWEGQLDYILLRGDDDAYRSEQLHSTLTAIKRKFFARV